MTEFNLATIQESIAGAYPDRDAIIQGEIRVSGPELTERSRRVATVLAGRDLGAHRERTGLAAHESGQDHIAFYLHDGPEYIEAMLGAYKARAVPFNVNYRYVAAELGQVFATARTRAVVYHGAFTPVLGEVLAGLPPMALLLRVDDGSGHPLLPGAIDYATAVADAVPHPVSDWSPDDLYLLLTGGTTGLPKGVLWRQADIAVAGMSVWDVKGGREWPSLDDHLAAAASPLARRVMVAPPLMHGAGQWMAFQAILNGGALVLPTIPHRREPADILAQTAEHAVDTMVIVGDAFARPMLDELRRASYDLSALRLIASGGAVLTAETKAALLDLLPHVTVLDAIGASETGGQARARSSGRGALPPGCFHPAPGTVIVNEDRDKVLDPSDNTLGWLGRAGRIPLGYLDDPDSTATTFPVVDGVRMAVPGDRARYTPEGLVQLLGRDSVTINSGGEKIFAEEVEAAILADPRVQDVTVVGRASPRWGSEVVAVVSVRPGASLTGEEVRAAAAGQLAAYKLPKDVVFVDEVHRSPAGKPDYGWAAQAAAGEG